MSKSNANHTEYEDFLASKRTYIEPSGFDVPADAINPQLFPFQRDIVRWALKRGKAALFEDCGLGKTPQQLEWAKHVAAHTGKPVLILAPLAVSGQTAREGEKFGIYVTVCATQADVQHGVNVTNYHKLHKFDCAAFGGIVLDESSILKGKHGITRNELNEFAESIPYRLVCSATPSPNDLTELNRQAEFLGIMQEKEALALYFTQDGNTTTKWRLKRHAVDDFWQYCSQWAVAIRSPADLGYGATDYNLPELNMIPHIVEGQIMSGMLIQVEALSLSERRQARRDSLEQRVKVAAELANNSDKQWLIWCDLNKESEMLARLIPDAVEVAGKHDNDHKSSAMLGFADGKHRVLISKPTIAGFGMNWQNCHNMIFCGLSDSYEQQYQAIRRCYRFGQTKPVNVHVITARTEGAVVANIERKEKQATQLFDEISRRMSVYSEVNGMTTANVMEYSEDVEHGQDWTLYLGDSVLTIDNLEDDSIGLSVFSPPFPGMYTYTNSPHDMGNVANNAEMIEQFSFLAEKILTKTMPGRSCAIHLTQGTAQKGRDGYVGLKDFRGQVIQMMQRAGWIYYGEVCIDKNPQVKAIRTRDSGLQFKSLATDSARMHMAMADYMLQFRKPGDNPVPIRAGISSKYKNSDGWITQEEWIRWARPVWYAHDWTPDEEIIIVMNDDNTITPTYRSGEWDAIRETDVLNVKQARETNDERHLCPLQLGVIERSIKLWTNPGEIVYTPFAGVGSEVVTAVKLGRVGIGGELKKSYWESAIRNCRDAVREKGAVTLFDMVAA